MNKYITAFILMFVASFSIAQIEDHEIDIIKELALEEQEIIEALVLYPKEIRELIFEASTHAEVIVKFGNVQSRTSKQFNDLITKYPDNVQKGVWEMTRYPNLIDRLVKNPENLEAILKQYPEKVRESSKSIVKDEYILLKEISKLDALSQSTFKRILEPLPESTQTVFNELLQYPEILDLLSQNVELTILGGDFYKKAPDLVRHHADSLNLVITRQQALELENWRNQLENDPQAAEELKRATIEFAGEYDYDEESIAEGKEKEVIDDLYYDDEEYDYDDEDFHRIEHHYYHYPYWFGYPHWYGYAHWRPYPFWYEWGFYWTPYGTIAVYHMPSPFFMHWYFYNPYHHYRYVHLSNHFINHYYGHRASGSSIVGTVRSWRTTNRGVVRDDWLSDENKRIPALKEFGKMEDARTVYNSKHPKDELTNKEFVQKHEKKYPNLSGEVDKYKPRKEFPKDKPEVQKTKKDTKIKRTKPKTDIEPIPQKKPRKEKQIIRFKKAQDYHKQTWQQTKKRPPARSKPAVVPKPPAPKSKTKPQSPRQKRN